MNILKYKYKAHRLVNTLFYVVVFFVGFSAGFFTNKIGFNNLISQVLMIDNVYAYDIPIKDNNKPINEEFIYSTFTQLYDDFDIKKTPYIFCVSTSGNYVCYAGNNEFFDLLSVGSSWNSYYFISINAGTASAFSFMGCQNSSCINKTNINWGLQVDFSENTEWFLVPKSTPYGNNNERGIYTNFDLSEKISGADVLTGNHNVFDFSFYTTEYNENLFKDNPDFKQVCVDTNKSYAITSTNIDPITNTLLASDFIWFPGKATGIKYKEYDSMNEDKILVFGDDYQTDSFYFKDKDTINSIYNDEISSNYFNHSGYTDKYSYLGYTAYKFIHSYYVDDNGFSQNMFTIFDFSDINFSAFGSAGGSSSSFGDTPLNYCFYVKKEFNVTELQTDEWYDYSGLVDTPGGLLEIETSYNKNHASEDSDLYFSHFNEFISQIKPTVDFINSYIYDLYISMPLIVRLFIISLLMILLVKIIIGMVVR